MQIYKWKTNKIKVKTSYGWNKCKINGIKMDLEGKRKKSYWLIKHKKIRDKLDIDSTMVFNQFGEEEKKYDLKFILILPPWEVLFV